MARTDVASRVIPASPKDVYAALVDPDALVAWLPPDGMSGGFERFDRARGRGGKLGFRFAVGSLRADRGARGRD